MKKLFFLLTTVLAVAFAGDVFSTPGPHTVWAGDTLKKNTTLTDSDYVYMQDYDRVHVWVKSTNPADSTVYRLYYKTAFSLADVFAPTADSVADDVSTTLINVDDTLWHYRSVTVHEKLFLNLKATSHATTHGNRCRVWLKILLSKD